MVDDLLKQLKSIFKNEITEFRFAFHSFCVPTCPIGNLSALVPVMDWRDQATSYHINQCWLRFMKPNVVAWPQWVDKQTHAFVYRLIVA